MTRRKIEYWEIPPDQDTEFVACMEDVLETYEKAYVPLQPVQCMDEQPVQLLKVWWTPKGGPLGPGNERVILTHLVAK